MLLAGKWVRPQFFRVFVSYMTRATWALLLADDRMRRESHGRLKSST